jgi:tRNA(Arg) A34 adenosine deaminase TadA
LGNKRFMAVKASTAGLILLLLGLVFQSQIYRLRPRAAIPEGIKNALQSLANQALLAREVPVGAVLVYGDSIIGRGFNTVVRDTNLSGHAEINALIDAHQRHLSDWKSFDRSKMLLYSTYEPCGMCAGAMLNLNITRAVFEGPKSATDGLYHTLKGWGYEFKKARFNAPGMQDSLFWRHPDFPQRRK